jgi:hypothetical protein
MTNHEQIVAAYGAYMLEYQKFTDKRVKISATRARLALQDISKCIKERRREITAELKSLPKVG